MIISHRHRFIFIKTAKTAGTSVEIALSSACGPDDVITPISPADEEVRRALGYRGAQNYLIPWVRHSRAELGAALATARRLRFYNHCGASLIRPHVDPEVWDGYLKLTIERNPWDKVISGYFWDRKFKGEMSLQDYVTKGFAGHWSRFDAYSLKGEIIVDEVLRYENLKEDLARLFERLGLGAVPEVPRTKSESRTDRRPYQEMYGDAERDHVARIFAREIAYFGYRY